MNEDKPPDSNDQVAARLGRASARLARQAQPGIKRLAEGAKPLVNKAAQYAVEHQDELKATGIRLLRARAAGPLGLAVDVAARAAASGAASRPVAPKCARCGAENPKNARFCNQCATPLENA